MGWFEDQGLSDPPGSGPPRVDYGDLVTTPPLGTGGGTGTGPTGPPLTPTPPSYQYPDGSYHDTPYVAPKTGGTGSQSVADFVNQFAHFGWVGNDVNYWIDKINQTGGMTPANQAYWSQRMTDPPGVGSNAGHGTGTSLGQSFSTPPPAYTPFEPSYFSGSPNTTPYQAPAPFTGTFDPATFNYGAFTAPDPNAVKADQAYQFRLKAGEDALQASASARGTLRTGGTLKDIAAWASDFASSEYDKIYGRAMDEWRSGFDVSKGTYDTNTNAALAKYNTGLDTYKTNADVGYNAWNANNTNAMNNFNAGLDVFKTNNQSAYNANTANNAGLMAQWAAQYGMSQDEINNLIKYAGIGSTAAANAPPPVPTTSPYVTPDPGAVAQPNGQQGGSFSTDLYRPIPSEDLYQPYGGRA